MSFWNLSDGQQAQQQSTFEMGGGDLAPIPANTQLKAFAEEAKWEEHNGERKIKIKWDVIDGEFKGRKVFQNIKVCDSDAKKRDKAIKMLSAIDTNSGGGLMRTGQEPTDMDLQINLCNKPMAILVHIWKITDDQTGEVKEGNWVGAVSPLNRKPQTKQQPQHQMSPGMNDNDLPEF